MDEKIEGLAADTAFEALAKEGISCGLRSLRHISAPRFLDHGKPRDCYVDVIIDVPDRGIEFFHVHFSPLENDPADYERVVLERRKDEREADHRFKASRLDERLVEEPVEKRTLVAV